MEDVKILYIAQEIMPYVPESEISAICRKLPQAVQEKQKDVRLFMPKFGNINERRNQLHEVIRLSGQNIAIDDTDHPLIIKVASVPAARMQVYFIDNEDFFLRKGIVADAEGNEFEDNDERAIFFARGVLETVRKLRWTPDIIHCHGWFSSLIPFYVKKACSEDPFFKDAKIVTSLYNDSFKTPFSNRFGEKVMFEELAEGDADFLSGKEMSYTDLIKFALDFSDGAIVSGSGVDSEIVDYAKANTKNFMAVQDAENYVDEYDQFYNDLLK